MVEIHATLQVTDQPFSESVGRDVLQLAAEKLARPTLYSNAMEPNIYICNTR